MSAYAIAFLSMLGASLLVVSATAAMAARPVFALQRRARAFEQHPTLVALRESAALGDKLRGLQGSLVEIRARSARIAEATADLIATSGMLRLQVDRISFATRLLLGTFVPTLRGSMSD